MGKCHEATPELIWMGRFASYSSDLVPSDYYLFTSPRVNVGGKNFPKNEEVKGEVEK